MAIIKLFDYNELIEDDWWGSYEVFRCIGQGDLAAAVVVPQIDAVPDGEEITVKINSVGGYVFDGWSIYNALIAAKKRGCKIIARIEGLAASIASVIAMAGDDIIICQAAMLMIHKPTVDPFWYGSMDAEDLKREAAALDQIQAVLNDIYVSKTGLESDVVDSMINAETWITPSQARLLGFATEIEATITVAPIASMPENAFNHLFKNADAQVRAYANKTITVNKNPRIMNAQEVLQQNTEAMNKSNSLLGEIKEAFKNLFKPKNDASEATNASSELSAGGSLYYDGTLEVGTEVFTDAEMTTHPAAGSHELSNGDTITTDDGGIVTEITEASSEAENASETQVVDSAELEQLRAENQQLQTALNTANEQIAQVNAVLETLKNVKSTYEPSGREQEIQEKGPKSESAGLDLSPEAREARRKEREEKRNNKNKK